jgi:hypothetical protein
MRKREIEIARMLIEIPKKELLSIRDLLRISLDETSLGFHCAENLKGNGIKIVNDILKYSIYTILNQFYNSTNNLKKMEIIINNAHQNFFIYKYGEGVDYLELIEAILFTKKKLSTLIKNPNKKNIRYSKLLYLKLLIKRLEMNKNRVFYEELNQGDILSFMYEDKKAIMQITKFYINDKTNVGEIKANGLLDEKMFNYVRFTISTIYKNSNDKRFKKIRFASKEEITKLKENM